MLPISISNERTVQVIRHAINHATSSSSTGQLRSTLYTTTGSNDWHKLGSNAIIIINRYSQQPESMIHFIWIVSLDKYPSHVVICFQEFDCPNSLKSCVFVLVLIIGSSFRKGLKDKDFPFFFHFSLLSGGIVIMFSQFVVVPTKG